VRVHSIVRIVIIGSDDRVQVGVGAEVDWLRVSPVVSEAAAVLADDRSRHAQDDED
jgi:hypothetical protein